MSTLNRKAKEVFLGFGVSACTDVTGFGLLGHACEMIEDQDVGLRIYPERVPLIDKVLDLARMGIVPAGTLRNLSFRRQYLTGAEKVEPAFMDILFDPQTSGGLLIAVKAEEAELLVTDLRGGGIKDASIIGEFVEGPKGKIVIQA
jgi:selenide,water dikinase